MTRLRTLSLLVLVACLTMGIAAGSGAASAASHHVICKIKVLHKKRVVSCPKGPLRETRRKGYARRSRHSRPGGLDRTHCRSRFRDRISTSTRT